MKKHRWFFLVIILLSLHLHVSGGNKETIYRHPRLDFRFEAPEGWRNVRHVEDNLIYEVMDHQSRLHVMLWYTETEQSAPFYLDKMADMKGFAAREAARLSLDDRATWLIGTTGWIYGAEAHIYLAAIPLEIPERAETALYIVQIWCPEKDFEERQALMMQILESVRVNRQEPASEDPLSTQEG